MKMKSILLALVAVALLCTLMLPTSVAAASENLASNGDFEAGNTSGWVVYGGYVISREDNAAAVYEGDYALDLTATTPWAEAALKTIPVLKNATITVSFYYNHFAGDGDYYVFTYQGADTSGSSYDGASAWMPTRSDWRYVSYTFNSGDFDHITLKFCPSGQYNYVHCAIDNLVVTMEGGDIPENMTPYLTSFGTKNNRPKDAASNLIQNGGFESTSAQWDTTSFIKGNLSVVEDATAPEGDHSLYLRGDSAGFHTFPVAVEPVTQYTFSAWVKSPRLSADNRATATFGVMSDQSHFMVYEPYRGNGHGEALLSSEEMQLMATSPDGEWHLRSVTFYSGSATTVYIGVYGADSQLYLDDVALFKSVNAVEYFSPLRTESLQGILHDGDRFCADADSLIEGIYMTSNDQQLYWSDNPAWRNGFLSFEDCGDDHGTVLKYSQSAHPEWKLNYIKWIAVKPHTDYTFTMDIKVLESGSGSVALLDDNVVAPGVFSSYSLYAAEGEWETYSITFNSGVYSRIGFAIVDGGGAALIDEVRLFENDDAVAEKPTEKPAEPAPTLKPLLAGTSVMEMGDSVQTVLNGGFEDGMNSWDVYQGTAVTADAAYKGGFGAHLKGDGSWDALLEQVNIPVEDGKTYTLSYWYKSNSSGANVSLKGATTGAQYTYAWTDRTEWTQVTQTFTVAGDTSLVLNLCGGGNGTAEDIYIDAVYLIPADDPALLGVAFLMELEGNRIYMGSRYQANLTSATVNPYGDERAYTLLRMGAVMTNQTAVGSDESTMVLDNVNGHTVADVPAVYLWSVTGDGCQYSVRVVNVPLTHSDTVIYARPYYVYEKDGEEIIVYGDIFSRSYDE